MARIQERRSPHRRGGHMNRRSFLAGTSAAVATAAFPAVLRAQAKDPIRIGFPLPLTGPFGALAADMQRGGQLAVDELNAKGGVLGRRAECLFRADQPKPALGATPYPLGSAEFSAHLPKIQAAKPDVLMNAAPGADNIALLKQVASFGMRKDMKVAQPLLWISYLKEGGPELYEDVYGAINWYWELQDSIPSAKKFVEASMRKFNMPPGDYGAYAYSGVLEVARGVELAKSTDSEAVANALRKRPVYDHFKGKQWWRTCDNKSFQDCWIVKGRGPGKVKGEWGLMDIVAKVPGSEEQDRTCAEKGLA